MRNLDGWKVSFWLLLVVGITLANLFRWAAKEAVIKAHKRKLYMRDIEIAQNPASEAQNQPPVALLRHPHEVRKRNRTTVVQLSISHDGDYATATCLAYDSWAKDDWIQRWGEMGASKTKRHHKSSPTTTKGKHMKKGNQNFGSEEDRWVDDNARDAEDHWREEDTGTEEVSGVLKEELGWIDTGFQQNSKT